MYDTATIHRRRGRTRIWDDILPPPAPMKPEKNPDGALDPLIEQVFHPLRAMTAVTERGRALRDAPRGVWLFCTLVAVIGSLIYGASLQLVLPAGGAWTAALALTVSAAAGWLLFGPVLCALSRKPVMHIAHACLIAMIYGEGVLELGVLTNFLMFQFGPPAAATSITVNVIIVAAANIVMLIALTAQLKVIRVPRLPVTLLWLLILNGGGIAVFRQFYPALFPF